ncbi:MULTISPECIES: hypothetical protein [unclassified Pseudodesulfovibrio]|uniref:hypothetical protein n=1 Tax=unclassified Pseudodesulfovibrio TaxID=2661612 RepID=UPI000FEBECCB|nr:MULTISPECIES: hypothetical protein [unclassified Pseudodesulfovibrio]MCJ2166329.1 hypothetical protein [Pseudodesulfovibrio sp. S3-i]RWU03845.1 hypothetical protein DWB63_10345 [Pseudodesulfovibrio sp. S3]
MIDYIEIDSDDIVYCPILHDGRLKKINILSLSKIIYVCEECELIWESVDNIVLNKPNDISTVKEYIRSIGITMPPFIKAEEWGKYIEHKGYLRLKDLECFLKDKKIIKI